MASGLGVAIAENDFVEDVDDVIDLLCQDHAHGTDVEIESPHEGVVRIEGDVADVEVAIEGIVDAMNAGVDKLRAEFLVVGFGVKFAGGAGEFGAGDEEAFGSGELEGLPLGVVVGVFEVFVKMIAAFRRTDEESAAMAIGEGGAKDFAPGFGFDGGEFVEDEKIEADAAEGIRIVCAVDDDGGTVGEIDAALGFVGFFGPIRAGDGFEAIPDDAFGLAVVRADVPDELVGILGSAQHFTKGKKCFTEATSGDDDAEAGGTVVDLGLVR